MIVIVEESQAQAIESDQNLFRQLAAWFGGTLLIGALVTLGLVIARRRALRTMKIQNEQENSLLPAETSQQSTEDYPEQN